MLRYIDMPKLVAWYLREFSYNKDGEPSTLYKFVFCLCLPFISKTFRTARLNALAIAECTNSQDQICKVFNKITGADIEVENVSQDYLTAYNGTADSPDFAFNGQADAPQVTFVASANAAQITITLNGASKSEALGYLNLLVPFYVYTILIWK